MNSLTSPPDNPATVIPTLWGRKLRYRNVSDTTWHSQYLAPQVFGLRQSGSTPKLLTTLCHPSEVARSGFEPRPPSLSCCVASQDGEGAWFSEWPTDVCWGSDRSQLRASDSCYKKERWVERGPEREEGFSGEGSPVLVLHFVSGPIL